MKIIAEIPARFGSQRVKNKNLRLLSGKPMISYAIEAAKESTLLSEIYVNSDSDEIGELGKSLGVKYYKRPKHLATDTATSDDYNYDFIKSIQPDLLVQVNPVNPLIMGKDIDDIIKYFLAKDIDSLITVREERLQAFCNGESINFNVEEQLPRTQDIPPVYICVWPVCIWKKDTFMKNYEEQGHAIFSGRFDLYPVSAEMSLKISYEEDFIFAEKLLKLRNI